MNTIKALSWATALMTLGIIFLPHTVEAKLVTRQLVHNYSFENDNAFWESKGDYWRASNGWYYAPGEAYTGDRYAMLITNLQTAHYIELQQNNIVVPKKTKRLILSFWYDFETINVDKDSKCELYINDVRYWKVKANHDETDGYVKHKIELPADAFKGEEVQLAFTCEGDINYGSYLNIDDVRLNAKVRK